MWLLVAGQPKPDAAYWPGRRWFAAIDAVAWPALWVVAVFRAPVPTGIFGHVIVALAIVFYRLRLATALTLFCIALCGLFGLEFQSLAKIFLKNFFFTDCLYIFNYLNFGTPETL